MAADEAHQRTEDVIEPAPEPRFDLGEVAESRGHLEAGEHLAQRAERGVVSRRAIPPRL